MFRNSPCAMGNGLCQMQNDRNLIWRYQNRNSYELWYFVVNICIWKSWYSFLIQFWSFRLVFVVCVCVWMFGWFRVDYTFRVLHVNISYLFVRCFDSFVLSLLSSSLFTFLAFCKFARRNKKHQKWNWFGIFMSVEITNKNECGKKKTCIGSRLSRFVQLFISPSTKLSFVALSCVRCKRTETEIKREKKIILEN